MTTDRMKLVRALAKLGFSHVRALEIAIEYENGTTLAWEWIEHVMATATD